MQLLSTELCSSGCLLLLSNTLLLKQMSTIIELQCEKKMIQIKLGSSTYCKF